ncbi:cytidylate kinase [Methylacidiphilum caldifontis]|uniref:Multifunctional fusion protein n=1 Tax=Methylacidiphilum caldifontis TaxID=2795386 RepID=A0A4Y8PBQ9_9BACT|nr:3-phosphoshikimate 1-carboxyvinyltransferase [Methylacidiphilum caldifontis]TFE68589.1 cytidylate kinase [Methylacidiphilum caldifontis]
MASGTPSYLIVEPCPVIKGEIEVPGDKSISHRAIMLASLARGKSKIRHFLPSEDCLCTLKAFEAMGVRVEKEGKTTLFVEGKSGILDPPFEALDCGNSGTMMRLMAGILSAQPFYSRLVGDRSLSRRPMHRIIEPLRLMEAKIRAEGEGNTPPLFIEPSSLKGIEYKLPIPSAQVKSCILFAGLFASGITRVIESVPSRDHTERLFEQFGVRTLRENGHIVLHGGMKLESADIVVPGDFSSAAFWIGAAAALPNSELRVRSVGLNPTRTGLIKILLRMGAQIEEFVESDMKGEPIGSLWIRGNKLKGTVIEGDEIVGVIDELPILAVVGALAEGVTEIRNAQELRVKETDRIKAIVTNLRAFGVEVEELVDGMRIQGRDFVQPARVESFGDHRIAMAFAILALRASRASRIDDVDCISTSYPGFEQDLNALTHSFSKDWIEEPNKKIRGFIERLTGADKLEPVKKKEIPYPVITIDGTTASGKSTVAQEIAKALGFTYFNTGALYRAVTWRILSLGYDVHDEEKVVEACSRLKLRCAIQKIDSFYKATVILDERVPDEKTDLRSAEVNAAVSIVASYARIREWLLPFQRELAYQTPLVVEGRDMGSVVFPESPYKFFLDAQLEEREKRREKQGEKDDVEKRDRLDQSRSSAPLLCPADAVRLDTTKLSIEKVVDKILDVLWKKGLPITKSKA